MNTMNDKVALITGASTGIGRAAALAFAHEGAQVVLADVDDERGEKLAAEIDGMGVPALFVLTDVAQPDHVN